MGGRRIHYIDWLRVLAVLLLLPFHSARVFDVWEPFYAKSAETSVVLSYFIAFVSFWHMPLLFFLAGASTWLGLGKRTALQYLSERAQRLLVPFVFGMLVIVPPQFWYGARQNTGHTRSFAAFWPTVWRFDISKPDYFGGFGFGHLWFIIFLFVFATALLPGFLWLHRRRSLAERWARALARPVWWWLPVLILLIADGGPDLPNDGMLMIVFLALGFVVMADGSFSASARKHRHVTLALTVALTVFCVFFWEAAEAAPDISLVGNSVDVARLSVAWLGVVTAVGYGSRHLDFKNGFLGYMAEASYPVYILHQTVIVVIGFYVVRLAWGVWPGFALVLAGSTIVTFALYDLVRRTPVTRFLFGMRPAPRREPVPAERPAEA